MKYSNKLPQRFFRLNAKLQPAARRPMPVVWSLTSRILFGVRRLDAALFRRGLTRRTVSGTGYPALWMTFPQRYLSHPTASAPHQAAALKAASSRRTPNSFSGFVSQPPVDTKPLKLKPSFENALRYWINESGLSNEVRCNKVKSHLIQRNPFWAFDVD